MTRRLSQSTPTYPAQLASCQSASLWAGQHGLTSGVGVSMISGKSIGDKSAIAAVLDNLAFDKLAFDNLRGGLNPERNRTSGTCRQTPTLT